MELEIRIAAKFHMFTQTRIEMLKAVVEKAAITSIELGVSSEEATTLFQKLYRQHEPKQVRRKK